jgi:hypothetical protein
VQEVSKRGALSTVDPIAAEQLQSPREEKAGLFADCLACDETYFQARWQNCEKRLLASSCLSVLMKYLDSHCTDFDEF